jgi:hypothetical protein
MTLSELWAALARGEREALQTAYLHRVMRERANGQIAELFHLFHQDASEATRRQIGSRVLGWDHNVISVEINNG